MKHIRTYENLNIQSPKKGDWIVAYRPKNDYDKDIVMFNSFESVIDYGKVLEVILASEKGTNYYGVLFKNAGKYLRTNTHILYVAENEADAEENMKMIKTTNKYNL